MSAAAAARALYFIINAGADGLARVPHGGAGLVARGIVAQGPDGRWRITQLGEDLRRNLAERHARSRVASGNPSSRA